MQSRLERLERLETEIDTKFDGSDCERDRVAINYKSYNPTYDLDASCEAEIDVGNGVYERCRQRCAARFEVGNRSWWAWLCERHLRHFKARGMILAPSEDFEPDGDELLEALKFRNYFAIAHAPLHLSNDTPIPGLVPKPPVVTIEADDPDDLKLTGKRRKRETLKDKF